MLLAFVIITTALFAALFLIWQKSDFLNFFIKYTFMVMTALGIYLLVNWG